MRFLALAVAVLSLQTFAQTQPAAAKQAVPKPQVITFTNDVIDGAREVPLATIYSLPEHPRFKSLIQIRQNFNDALARSVNEM